MCDDDYPLKAAADRWRYIAFTGQRTTKQQPQLATCGHVRLFVPPRPLPQLDIGPTVAAAADAVNVNNGDHVDFELVDSSRTNFRSG